MFWSSSDKRRSIVGDERGTSLAEFAAVAPVLGLMLVGIADYSMGYWERFGLEAAAHRTVERANADTTSSGYSYLREEAAIAADVPVANVTLETWRECNGTRQATFDGICDAGQEIARYVRVKIVKDYVPTFSWNGSAIRISGDAAVRVL